MKMVSAFIHHVKAAPTIQALSDAGYENITVLDVKGALKAISDNEKDYSAPSGLSISETCVSLICQDDQVEGATDIIREVGTIGEGISGWVYVSPIELALPIGDSLG